MITKEMLLETGRRKKLTNKGQIEKIYFQDLFLFNLFRKSNNFIFKGGTALYKFYNLQRFSEDLDFSVSEDMTSGEIEKIIEEVIHNIPGFKIKSIKRIKSSILIKISCQGILTNYNSLRVDINLKNKPLKGFDIKNYIPDYIDINPFSLRVLKLDEIVAEKIHALFNRKKARDLYDLFFLLRMANFDRLLIDEKLKLFDMKFDKKELEKRILDIRRIWDNELRIFVLGDLPNFDVVKDFVFSKIF